MKKDTLRKLFLGFMQIHILYHAQKEPIYGSYMMEELKKHGYDISAGTLYPLLHNMAAKGLLQREAIKVNGKIRKYYSITATGEEILKESKEKALELVKELNEG